MAKGFTIAVSGKGGTGKTMLSALLVKYFSEVGSVFAIDADPDSNLPQALGTVVSKSVGDEREAILNTPSYSGASGGIDKRTAFRAAISGLIVETPPFDVIAMGRSEGEGCYCPINDILCQAIDTMVSSYDFIVIDCEAGLEHLSRRTERDVDIMLVITEPTMNGVLTAKRVQELAKELRTSFGTVSIIANKVTPETKPALDKTARENDVEIADYIPYDPNVYHFDIMGKPIIELPEDSVACIAVSSICHKIIQDLA